jgi:hypothetical protein
MFVTELTGFGRSMYVLISVCMKGYCKLDSEGKRRGRRATKKEQPSVVWSFGTPVWTLPLCPLTVLHLRGRCHDVPCGSRRWWDPRELRSRGRGMAPHSPRPCTVHPSFPGTLVDSRIFHPRSRTGPPSLSFLFSLVCRSHASLSSEPHPVLSPLSPLKARVGGCTMVMWFPTSCSTGDFPPRRLRFWCAAPPPPSTRL